MKEVDKEKEHVEYLVGEILKTCHDEQSCRFYTKVARLLPDEVIFRFLAEIRQDSSINNRGAVFTAKVKQYLGEQEEETPE